MKRMSEMNGYILAGGKSSRMGEDKGLLKVDNRSMIEFVIQHLQPCVQSLFICSDNLEYRQFGFEVIPDPVKSEGPVTGIYAALHHATSEKIFVLGCDTPFVDEVLIQRIISLSGDADITVPLVNGWMEPLCGVYSTASRKLWKERMESGIRKMQTMIENFNYKTLDCVADLHTSEFKFMNINTPDDLERAKKEGIWL